MAKAKINWLEAYQDYLATKEMSLGDVAEKYKVSLSRVKKVSMIRKWTITKNRVWEAAEEQAIEETISSAKELIKRHSETARYLQEAGVKWLKRYLKSKKSNELKARFLLRMIIVGLKAERALYPKELRFVDEAEIVNEGLSPELEGAIYESFRKKIGRKKPSIHARPV